MHITIVLGRDEVPDRRRRWTEYRSPVLLVESGRDDTQGPSVSPIGLRIHIRCWQVARCTKIINAGQDDAKYVINVRQIAKFVVGLGEKVQQCTIITTWSGAGI